MSWPQGITPKQHELLEGQVIRLRKQNPHWREGQYYFNALEILFPKVANGIRGTKADPFYSDNPKDEVFEEFFKRILA